MIEIVTETYEDIEPDEKNAILRKMIKVLGKTPSHVERATYGMSASRSDVWDCGCRREYIISMYGTSDVEGAYYCDAHRSLFDRKKKAV